MKQTTITSVEQALRWINGNAHPEVGTDYHPTKVDEKGFAVRTHMYFKNNHEKMRVPEALLKDVFKYIRPNKRAFDTRMFAVTRKGKEMIR